MIFGALGELAIGENGTSGLFPPGIDSEEAFGDATVSSDGYILAPPGIDTAEAFGSTSITMVLEPPGIDSEEAFGASAVWEIVIYKPVSRVK